MFKVYYYYNCDKYKTTVYAVRRDYLDTVFLVYIGNEWQWINAECCKPCEDGEN